MIVTSLNKKELVIKDLGLIPYDAAYVLQQNCVQQVLAGGPPILLLCEHPAVLTLGRLASWENVLYSQEQIAARGIKIIAIDRGGEVTLHSPGQLVVYPILNLNEHGKDLKSYLRKLEDVAIDFLLEFDILAFNVLGKTGVWVYPDPSKSYPPKKIVSVGVGVKKWISYHGIAINILTDLSLFSLIRPCGLDAVMTSIADLKRQNVDFNLAKQKFVEVFRRHFDFYTQQGHKL